MWDYMRLKTLLRWEKSKRTEISIAFWILKLTGKQEEFYTQEVRILTDRLVEALKAYQKWTQKNQDS